MNTPQWMIAEKDPAGPRARARRKPMRRPSLMSILAVGVVLAWGWGVFELTLLVLK
jgi:hypothetical protein